MLILARKIGESVVIGEGIVITVLEGGRQGQVRLGIEAPRSVRVYRQELLQQIQAENQAAAGKVDAAAVAALTQLFRLPSG